MKTQIFKYLGSESSFIKCHYQTISILIKKQYLSIFLFLSIQIPKMSLP